MVRERVTRTIPALSGVMSTYSRKRRDTSRPAIPSTRDRDRFGIRFVALCRVSFVAHNVSIKSASEMCAYTASRRRLIPPSPPHPIVSNLAKRTRDPACLDQARQSRVTRRSAGPVKRNRLRAFGNDIEAQGRGEVHNRPDDLAALVVLVLAGDERLIDFQYVRRETLQVAERRIAGPEVIEADAHAKCLQLGNSSPFHASMSSPGAVIRTGESLGGSAA